MKETDRVIMRSSAEAKNVWQAYAGAVTDSFRMIDDKGDREECRKECRQEQEQTKDKENQPKNVNVLTPYQRQKPPTFFQCHGRQGPPAFFQCPTFRESTSEHNGHNRHNVSITKTTMAEEIQTLETHKQTLEAELKMKEVRLHQLLKMNAALANYLRDHGRV